MTQVQLLSDLSNDVVFFAWAGSVAFLVIYIALARGWRTEIGRALIRLDAGLTLALGPSVMHRLFGLTLTSLPFAWYYVASIALVGYATWERVWYVVKVQARGAGLTPRQFARHLLCGARNVPGKLWAARRERRRPGPPPQAGKPE